MPKDYVLKVEPATFTISGQNVQLKHTTISEVVRKNWLLVAIYVALTIASTIVSYFTNQWVSVATTTGFALATFLVGLKMLVQVITITNEVR